MGLTVDGVANPTAPWNPAGDSAAFPVAHDAIVLSKLLLLDDTALNQLLADHGVPPLYQPGDNVMLGWPRSIDASNQWRKYSLLDGRRYGEGTFPLWQDCRARPLVFRVLFEDWEHGTTGLFPDDTAPGRAADIADCHGWTTVNKAPGLVSVSLSTAGDGSQSLLFRTSVATLPTKPGGRPTPLRTVAATPLPGRYRYRRPSRSDSSTRGVTSHRPQRPFRSRTTQAATRRVSRSPCSATVDGWRRSPRQAR